MSDNWIVQNLENALETWNDKLSEIWALITMTPQSFRGGKIWNPFEVCLFSWISLARTPIGYFVSTPIKNFIVVNNRISFKRATSESFCTFSLR